MEAFDEHHNAPWNNEKEYDCIVCGKPVYEEGTTCSSKVCRKVDNEL